MSEDRTLASATEELSRCYRKLAALQSAHAHLIEAVDVLIGPDGLPVLGVGRQDRETVAAAMVRHVAECRNLPSHRSEESVDA